LIGLGATAASTTGRWIVAKRRLIALATCAIAVAGLSGGPALAGEVTGNGKPTAGPANANSICVFSGKNDDPDRPLDAFDPGGPAQSYGQENKLGLQDPHVFNPGDACQGGSNFARTK
jgi:hypothetical protein